jgi:hypothetical protein
VEWRKNWAEINNDMFEYLKLDVRIDHRSYKEQGIDREPMIHMGHAAAAMERKGVKTDRGDYNRAVRKRNAEREARTAEQSKEESGEDDDESSVLKKERIEQRGSIRKLGQSLKAGEAAKIAKEKHERHKRDEDRQELEENYVTLYKKRSELSSKIPVENRVFPPALQLAKDLRALQARLAELQKNRQNLRLWEWAKKKEIDKEIVQVEQKIKYTQDYFRSKYHSEPSSVHAAANYRKRKKRVKSAEIRKIEEKMQAIKLAYHTQKLLADARPDHQQIEELREKMSLNGKFGLPRSAKGSCRLLRSKNATDMRHFDNNHNDARMRHFDDNHNDQSVRESIEHQKILRSLNTITEEDFQRVVKNLPENQAKILIENKRQNESTAKAITQNRPDP